MERYPGNGNNVRKVVLVLQLTVHLHSSISSFSGLAHFWLEPEKKEEEGEHATVDEVADGLTRLAKS